MRKKARGWGTLAVLVHQTLGLHAVIAAVVVAFCWSEASHGACPPQGAKSRRAAGAASSRTEQDPKCSPCRCKPDRAREIAVHLGVGAGGFYHRVIGWLRNDATLRVEVAVSLLNAVALDFRYTTSLERFSQGVGFGGIWYILAGKPYGSPYVKAAFDILMAGAGIQPALGCTVGYRYRTVWPIGFYGEAELFGTLREPRALQLLGWAGAFVYF
jgi:hypothetical protein